MTDVQEIINVSYTNWRGETKVRRVLLGQVRFGTTDWHEEPTWLISVFDLDHPAQIWKEFDLAKCDFNRDYMPGEIERLQDKVLFLERKAELALSLELSRAIPVTYNEAPE